VRRQSDLGCKADTRSAKPVRAGRQGGLMSELVYLLDSEGVSQAVLGNRATGAV
jgi:hypothetical protein